MIDTILPHELPRALEYAPEGVGVLSLDCFDTLLWRDCHAPTDVFSAFDHARPRQRIVGEANARKAEKTLRGRNEVGLGAIYNHVLPNANEAQREAAVTNELAEEARSCFAFTPTVELMRAAKARGLSVIIVSDTYLDASQLEALIRAAAGDYVADLIDCVFASSDAGISKGQGLLAKALMTMKLRPGQILHIGDNKKADFDASRALGVPALHLAQFSDAARQRLRFERAVQQIAGDSEDGVRGLMPHRAIIARDEPLIEDDAEKLGFTVLGPVFAAFDAWLRDEAEALQKARGGTVHWLFMLRDGHLPKLVHAAGPQVSDVASVEISRFTATAASLSTREVYERHVALENGLNPSTLARQMLFSEAEISRCIGDPRTAEQLATASVRLLSELRSGQRQKITRRRARGYAERLIAHVRYAVDPKPGDTLMLVDLGYNGSAQNRVDTLLSEAFDVHVAGRYLLLRELQATGFDKKGLIDPRNFDPEFLEALCANVAVIEQLATCQLGSVIDYTDGGAPIRNAISVKGRQSEVRDAVQRGVVRFAMAAIDPPIIRTDHSHETRGWRDTAASALARFMFLPQPSELEVVSNFEHDVNLGSERMVPLFDPDHAHEGMRRRGLFYMKGSSRMFLPAELACEDINTRLSLLVQNRFGLGLTYADHTPRTMELPLYYIGESDSARTTIKAIPTHDGYYVARIPLGQTGYGVGLQLGATCEWVEIASITCAPLKGLKGSSTNDTLPAQIAARFDDLEERAAGLFECSSEHGLALITPSAIPPSDSEQMIEIVFRPLRVRGEQVADIAGRTDAAQDQMLSVQGEAA